MSISNVSTCTLWTRRTSVESVVPRATGRVASCRALVVCPAPSQSIATTASDTTMRSAFFMVLKLSRSRRFRITCEGDKKEGPPFGGPSVKPSFGLFGEAREDRLRGRGRVVVDRDVAVLDVDGPRDELATGQGGRVAVEDELRARDVDRAGPDERSVPTDLHRDDAGRVLVDEQVRPGPCGLRGERAGRVALQVDLVAARRDAGRGWIVRVRVEDEHVAAGDVVVTSGIHAVLQDVDARIEHHVRVAGPAEVHGVAEVAPVTGGIAVHVERVRRLDVEAVTGAWPCCVLVVLRRKRGACRVDQDPAAVQLDAAVRLGVEGAAGVAAVERHDRVAVVQWLGSGDAACANRVERGFGRNQ